MVNIQGTNNPQVTPEKSQPSLIFTKRLSDTVSGTKCQILKEQGAKYCEETTLHGFQYLRTPGIVWKILWCIAVLTAVCTSVGFLASNWSEYLNAGTVTYINTTTAPLSDVFFPSVTICNVNQVKMSTLEKVGLNSANQRNHANYLMKYYLEGISKENPPANWSQTLEKVEKMFNWNPNNLHGISFVDFASQSCSDMMVHVSWRVNKSTVETHEYYETQKSHTDYGACCRLFPQLDFVNQKTKDLPTDQYTAEDFLSIQPNSKAGMENGLRLLVDVETFEYSFFSKRFRGTEYCPC